MNESAFTASATATGTAPPWTLEGIAAEAWKLEPLPGYLVGSILRPEAAELFDGLLARVARSRGALDVALGERLEALAEHFIGTWKEALRERSTRHRKVRARDGGWCQVPGCSRVAAHAHHVLYRSQGGRDESENLTSVCAVHHLHGLHRGFVRVRGRAPDALVWELGEPADVPRFA